MTKEEEYKSLSETIQEAYAAGDPIAKDVDDALFFADIARKISKLRKAARMSQKKLAKKVGTHQSAISRIEDDHYDGHSVKTLKRIADALGMFLTVEFSQEPKRATVQKTKRKSERSTTTAACNVQIRGEGHFVVGAPMSIWRGGLNWAVYKPAMEKTSGVLSATFSGDWGQASPPQNEIPDYIGIVNINN